MKGREKIILLIVTCIAAFATPFLTSGINVAIPIIGREYGVSAVTLPWVTTITLLGTAIFLVPAGKISDLLGHRIVLLYGTVFLLMTSLGIPFTPNFTWLIVLRFFQGCTGGLISSTAMALVASRFAKEERGRAMGIYAASVYLGLSIGPFIGGILTALFDWRSIFFSVSLLCAVSTVLIVVYLKPASPISARVAFDWKGSLLYALALILLMLGTEKLHTPLGFIQTITGVGTALYFLHFESCQPDPVFATHLFRQSRVFTFSCIAALINYGSVFAVSYLLSHYLQVIKGLSPNHAGLILVTQPIIQTVISPLAGKASDRFEPWIISSSGMAFCATGLLILSLIQARSGILTVLFASSILGIGYALFASPNTNAIMSTVQNDEYGVASGVLGAMRLLGQMSSMVIVTVMSVWFIGEMDMQSIPQNQFIRYIRYTFMILTAMNVVGIGFSVFRGSIRK